MTAEQARGRRQAGKARRERRLFVLDTNVLMHDPTSIFRFQEHDVYLPMVVLEELDANKKGLSEASRNVRQVSRFLDDLMRDADQGADRRRPAAAAAAQYGSTSTARTAADRPASSSRRGSSPPACPTIYRATAPTTRILAQTLALQALHHEARVTLVSKDINLRIKAAVVGVHAEDYYSDKTIEDADVLYTGVAALPADFWESHGKDMRVLEGSRVAPTTECAGRWSPTGTRTSSCYEDGEHGIEAIVRAHRGRQGHARARARLPQRTPQRLGRERAQPRAELRAQPADGPGDRLRHDPRPRGHRQDAAHAGRRAHADARIESLRRDHHDARDDPARRRHRLPARHRRRKDGALDGRAHGQPRGADAEPAKAAAGAARATNDLLRNRIKIRSLNFMRGRTFLNRYVILDEAQNLTPKQMKALVTRAGPGTKLVCLGNIAQIDTPYLTETTSGLTYVVNRFRGWDHSGHITLVRGERSRLADFASDTL